MKDAIDFSQAVMCGAESPDIRAWPIFSGISRVHFADRENAYVRGNVNVWFPGKTALVPANGTQGPISWTLWGGFYVSGKWCFCPLVECINDDYVPTGNLFASNQVATNLLYFADAPINWYQPKRGETIALVVTTGDTRRQNAQPEFFTPKRTNVVLVPFAVGDYTFADAGVEPPPVVVPPVNTGSGQTAGGVGPAFAELAAQVAALVAVGVNQADRTAALEQRTESQARDLEAAYARIGILEGRQNQNDTRVAALAAVKVPTYAEINLFGRTIRVPLRS